MAVTEYPTVIDLNNQWHGLLWTEGGFSWFSFWGSGWLIQLPAPVQHRKLAQTRRQGLFFLLHPFPHSSSSVLSSPSSSALSFFFSPFSSPPSLFLPPPPLLFSPSHSLPSPPFFSKSSPSRNLPFTSHVPAVNPQQRGMGLLIMTVLYRAILVNNLVAGIKLAFPIPDLAQQ